MHGGCWFLVYPSTGRRYPRPAARHPDPPAPRRTHPHSPSTLVIDFPSLLPSELLATCLSRTVSVTPVPSWICCLSLPFSTAQHRATPRRKTKIRGSACSGSIRWSSAGRATQRPGPRAFGEQVELNGRAARSAAVQSFPPPPPFLCLLGPYT